jgi:ankyrin repeat protein
VVRALLDNGADPKILGKDNFSALYWALFYKRTAAVKLLVERGADPGTMSVDIF